jgi:hypothetical protein
MTQRSMFLAGIVCALLAACGGDDLKGQGEECFGSSECADGLTCDFGQAPAVCAPMQTPTPDAMPVIDADPNAPDAPVGRIDAAPGTPDAAPGTPDATPAPIDATPPVIDATPIVIDATPPVDGTPP